MKLEELIKEVEKYVTCSKLDTKFCYKYEYCKDCPYDSIPIDDLMPQILCFLRTLRQ